MLSEVSNKTSLIKSTTYIYSDLSGLWDEFFSEFILGERTHSIVLTGQNTKTTLARKRLKGQIPL